MDARNSPRDRCQYATRAASASANARAATFHAAAVLYGATPKPTNAAATLQ